MTSPASTQPVSEDVEGREQYFGEWIECWQCGGEGGLEDCFEDCCVCMDPPCCWTTCDVCEGKGGWEADDTSEPTLRAAQAGGDQ